MKPATKPRAKSRSPWRYNPMCITPRAIAIFAEWRRERIAELEIDNTNPPPDHPESDLYRGP